MSGSITFRMDRVEFAELNDFMDRHGLKNRSDFIREAIAWALAHPQDKGAVQ